MYLAPESLTVVLLVQRRSLDCIGDAFGMGGAIMLEGQCHCGAVRWQCDAVPESVTACSCTACRRYGALWAYGHEGEDIHVAGEAVAYQRGASLTFNFCAGCGCVTHWRGLQLDEQGRRRIAVNLRMAEPGTIAALPIDHFDGLETWEDLPRDGRCVQDLWF